MIAELIVAMMAITPTDQTINVTKGTKLDINNFAGDVAVKAWDKDAVRVQVNHSDRETVDIKQADQTVTIRSRSVRGGPPRSLDYTISVPSWMAVSVSGTYADVTLDGVGGDVAVDTTRGDITVKGGSGFVSLKSVQGEISLERTKGRIEVRAVNEGIHLADVSGDVSAESTNGSIILDRIDSANVDLYTVNGNISYDGPIKDRGLYRLTTHNGLIALPVPDRANATLTLRTYNGGIRSTFQLPGDNAEHRGKRMTLTLGNGSAHVELESFGGTISLRRPGEPRPETERKRGRERDKDKGDHGALHDVQAAVLDAMRDVQPEIDRAIGDALRDIEPAIDGALGDVMREIEAIMPVTVPMPLAVPVPMPHPMPMPLSVPMPVPVPR
jgi:putative adhesin